MMVMIIIGAVCLYDTDTDTDTVAKDDDEHFSIPWRSVMTVILKGGYR